MLYHDYDLYLMKLSSQMRTRCRGSKVVWGNKNLLHASAYTPSGMNPFCLYLFVIAALFLGAEVYVKLLVAIQTRKPPDVNWVGVFIRVSAKLMNPGYLFSLKTDPNHTVSALCFNLRSYHRTYIFENLQQNITFM
jgi:hypothetical protein